jgi:hypothetical protein
MSLVWRSLAVMALSASPLSLFPFAFGPLSLGLAAAASPSAPGNSSSGAQAGHKAMARAGTGPAKTTESPGPGAPGMVHGQALIGLGKSASKPATALRSLSRPGGNRPSVSGPSVSGPGVNGLNGPAVKGPGLGPTGELAARGTGSPHGTAADSRNSGIRTPQGGGTHPWGAGPGAGGGLPRRPGEINGSMLGTRGFMVAKIATRAQSEYQQHQRHGAWTTELMGAPRAPMG